MTQPHQSANKPTFEWHDWQSPSMFWPVRCTKCGVRADDNQMKFIDPRCGSVENKNELCEARINAYRLLAVNEGWDKTAAKSNGHAEYLKQRIEEIDHRAKRIVQAGYDTTRYLSDGLAMKCL